MATATLCHPTPAKAQDKPFKFELTPFAGYRVGGSFDEKDGDGRVELNDSNAQGIMFNIKANPNGQYELLYSRQSTDAATEGFLVGDPTIDMDVEHFHFGGTYLFEGDNTRPFIALTLGLTQFDPGITDSNSESFFSVSFGGGVQLNATKRLGVRLEARAFTTFVEDDSNIFCASSSGGGACLIQVDARTLTQWEARAGLVFRF
ncbi:MAG: porin family protein [Gammaproteobacteria bacterium]|nr:porin family protein [Gammaproteobacteria bacterium]